MAKRRSARRRKSSKRRRIGGDQSFAPSVISGTRRKRRTYHPVKRHKRRSRIGAVDSTVQTVGGALLGVGIGIVANMIVPDKMKGKVMSVTKTVVGAGIAYAGRKNPLMLGIGIGLAGNGATEGAKDFGVVKGIEEFMSGIGADKKDTMTIEMNGTPPNAGKLMSGAGEPQSMPSVISGVFMNGTNQSVLPSVISDAGDNF